MSDRTGGVLLVATSAASFGALAIFARIAYAGGADVTAVLFLRFALAGLVMTALVRLRREPWPRGRVLGGLVAMGALGYVGQSFSYFTALTMAPASLVALLLYAYPALVLLLSVVALKERLTPARTAVLALALLGTVLTIGPELGGAPLGIALGLSAAVIYSVYIVVGSRLTPRAGWLPASAVIVLAAAGTFGTLALVERPSFPATGAAWVAVSALALVSTVVAIATFFAGMERLGPTDASTLSTIEPIVTVALAGVVLGERLGAVQLVGGVLILVAVLVLARSRPETGVAVPAHADPG